MRYPGHHEGGTHSSLPVLTYMLAVHWLITQWIKKPVNQQGTANSYVFVYVCVRACGACCECVFGHVSVCTCMCMNASHMCVHMGRCVHPWAQVLCTHMCTCMCQWLNYQIQLKVRTITQYITGWANQRNHTTAHLVQQHGVNTFIRALHMTKHTPQYIISTAPFRVFAEYTAPAFLIREVTKH